MGEAFSQYQVNRVNLSDVCCLEYSFVVYDGLWKTIHITVPFQESVKICS